MTGRLRLLADADLTSPFPVDGSYATAVWLPVLGPAAYLVWQRAARLARCLPTGVIVDRDHLAASVGLPGGEHAALGRALGRLHRHGLVRFHDGALVVAVRAPWVPDAHLARLHPAIQVRHRRHRQHAG